MKRLPLRSKEINKELERYGIEFSKKDQIELVETENQKIVLINKEPAFFYYLEKIIPTLKYLQTRSLLKKITVDMGAIRFIVNGADIMRPGVAEIEENITKDEVVVIVDKNNQKPLAVGFALYDWQELKTMKSGKVVKNIHYVGDELWHFSLA